MKLYNVIHQVPSKFLDIAFRFFADNKFLVSLPADDVVKYGLSKGQELTEALLQTISAVSHYGKLLSAALHFLSYRQRTEWEIRQYLIKKAKSENSAEDVGEELIKQVKEKLKQLGLIDDQKFARTYIEEKRRIANPKGDRAIKAELVRKGIDKKIIDEELGRQEENSQISQLSLARGALQKRIKNKELRVKGIEQVKEKARLLRFLAGRGFSYETSYKAIEEVLGME